MLLTQSQDIKPFVFNPAPEESFFQYQNSSMPFVMNLGSTDFVPSQAKTRNTMPDTKSSSMQVSVPVENVKYKTELCKFIEMHGVCYRANCQFAHTRSEIRESPYAKNPKYKSINCSKFHSEQYCPYNTRCIFRHFHKKHK